MSVPTCHGCLRVIAAPPLDDLKLPICVECWQKMSVSERITVVQNILTRKAIERQTVVTAEHFEAIRQRSHELASQIENDVRRGPPPGEDPDAWWKRGEPPPMGGE